METLRKVRANSKVSLTGEEWRAVGRGRCAVSNYGRFRNNLGDAYLPMAEPYKRVSVDGRLRSLSRMITTAFLVPKSPEHNEVDHIDGDPTNNHLDNLRWVTKIENIRPHLKPCPRRRCFTEG